MTTHMCVRVRVSTSRRFVEEETANDDDELILYNIRRVSRTAEKVVFSIHTWNIYFFRRFSNVGLSSSPRLNIDILYGWTPTDGL